MTIYKCPHPAFTTTKQLLNIKMVVRYMLPQLKDEQDRLNGFN